MLENIPLQQSVDDNNRYHPDQSELQRIWKEKIKPSLKEIEPERIKSQQQSDWIGIAVATALFALLLLYFRVNPTLVLSGLVISMAVCGYKIYLNQNNYTAAYKKAIFSSIASMVTFNWEVTPHTKQNKYKLNSEGSSIFKEAKLYTAYDKIDIGDKLTADLDDLTLTAHEVNAKEDMGRFDVTIFDGFVLEVPVDNHFSGKTYVQTRATEGWTGGAGASWWSDVEDVTLEWNDFAEFLSVKSSDPKEVREVFTPDFMAVLHDWYKSHNHKQPLRLAFKNESIYITVPTRVSLEPSVMNADIHRMRNIGNTIELLRFVEAFVLMIAHHQHLRFDHDTRRDDLSEHV